MSKTLRRAVGPASPPFDEKDPIFTAIERHRTAMAALFGCSGLTGYVAARPELDAANAITASSILLHSTSMETPMTAGDSAISPELAPRAVAMPPFATDHRDLTSAMANEASQCDVATIGKLRPTQFTIGMREVEIKRQRWHERNAEQAVEFLKRHSIPIILGPANRLYIVDRHHLVRALHDEGVDEVPVRIVVDMSILEPDEFWSSLESRGWTHPFDAEGRRCDYGAIPKSVSDLIDDPFRSLAGALKRVGGYAKDKAPFSEFRWAKFLRARIDRKKVESDFQGALAVAMNLALTREAISLPGSNWLGVLSPAAHKAGSLTGLFGPSPRPPHVVPPGSPGSSP